MQSYLFRKKDITKLQKFCSEYDPQSVFLVAGNESYSTSGAKRLLQDLFNEEIPNSFSGFNMNPQIEDLKTGLSLFKKKNYQLIVSVGGGSVLDMAKLIRAFAFQDFGVEEYLQHKYTFSNGLTHLLAIPTTAGSGAETTSFAVLYDNKVKHSVASPIMLPDYVLLYPDLTYSLNPYLTACTGLDAFSQAIESVWNVNASSQSLQWAIKAIELVWENLTEAVTTGSERSRIHMQEAAYLAGRAINQTKTTAPHAVSYSFTSYYNIPHGHAVALSIPYFFHFNYHCNDQDCNDKRGAEEVRNRMDLILKTIGTDIDHVTEHLAKFIRGTGISMKLSDIIHSFEPQIIINNVNTERLKNNPRLVTKQVISEMIEQII